MATRSKTWIIVTPDGTELTVHDLKAFCTQRQLSYTGMYNAMKDETCDKSYEGYSRSHRDTNVVTPRSNTEPVVLHNLGLDKRTSRTADRTTLAAETGISKQSVWRLITGKAVSVRGWMIEKPSDIVMPTPNLDDIPDPTPEEDI